MRAVLMAVGVLLSLAAAANAQPAQCPDSTETRSTLAASIDDATAALRRNPNAPVPPVCLYERIASASLTHSDSTILKTLALSAEALKRRPDDPANLAARVVLLSRARRFAEVGPTVDHLFRIDTSRSTLAIHKLAIAAAIQTADTAAMRKYLGTAAARFPAATQIAAQYKVLQQVPRLRSLIDSVHRAMTADPSVIEGYASLASIYGNLGRPDSALFFTRRGIARGVKRPIVAAALESLIAAMMRRAQLLADRDSWRAALPVAMEIDSTLSTPASKYFVALSLWENVAEGARLVQVYLYALEPGGLPPASVSGGGEVRIRVLTCEKLSEMSGQLDLARDYLAAGGDQFARETIPGMINGMQKMRASIALLKPRCPG